MRRIIKGVTKPSQAYRLPESLAPGWVRVGPQACQCKFPFPTGTKVIMQFSWAEATEDEPKDFRIAIDPSTTQIPIPREIINFRLIGVIPHPLSVNEKPLEFLWVTHDRLPKGITVTLNLFNVICSFGVNRDGKKLLSEETTFRAATAKELLEGKKAREAYIKATRERSSDIRFRQRSEEGRRVGSLTPASGDQGYGAEIVLDNDGDSGQD